MPCNQVVAKSLIGKSEDESRLEPRLPRVPDGVLFDEAVGPQRLEKLTSLCRFQCRVVGANDSVRLRWPDMASYIRRHARCEARETFISALIAPLQQSPASFGPQTVLAFDRFADAVDKGFQDIGHSLL